MGAFRKTKRRCVLNKFDRKHLEIVGVSVSLEQKAVMSDRIYVYDMVLALSIGKYAARYSGRKSVSRSIRFTCIVWIQNAYTTAVA